MEEGWDLWPQLAAGKVSVARWPLCEVLLCDDKGFPWLVLVPRRAGVTELHHLSTEDQVVLMGEICTASRVMEKIYKPTKVNVGMLGNIVAQLHIHMIARFESDAAWPGPVWGKCSAQLYDPAALQDEIQRLRDAFATCHEL
eukprot:jgi/Chlat1/8914/Chrsp92S08228